MRTYNVVFSRANAIDRQDEPYFQTIRLTAKDYNDLARQVRALTEPEGYEYIGTCDDNQWYHPKIGSEA